MALTNPITKWKIDIGASKVIIKNTDSDLNPPGYISGFVASQKVEALKILRETFKVDQTSKNEQQQQHLLSKRAWDMALQPMKSLPMNMFMMYMAGNTISIFPIMMVVMMAWRPMKALMAVNAAFKPLEVLLKV